MQNTALKVPAATLPLEDRLHLLISWASRKMSERRIETTRRLTQQEIANLPENLRIDIGTRHQEM